MSEPPDQPEPTSQFVLYQTEDGRTRIDVRLAEQTVWLSQAQMAELFETTKQNVSLHLRNVFEEQELREDSVVKYYLTTAADSKNYQTAFYNLDAILAIGYRVRSSRGTQFRRWATERLKEYLIKGFVLDDQRLKEGKTLGADYFDELLERIRDIRASEKRFYQKVRDIYKLSADYDSNAAATHEFFQIVQNKLHWAVTGHTAAEIIALRADAAKPNMGLTTWRGAKVRSQDVTIAKNYLAQDEIGELNRVVTMWLDYAEDQAMRRQFIYMKDWREKLDAFLQFNDRAILHHAGQISMEEAHQKALEQYALFNQRRLEADAEEEEAELEREIKKLEHKPKPDTGQDRPAK